MVYASIDALTTYSRDHIDNLIVCYTGDDKDAIDKLDNMLDDIPVNSTLLQNEYNFAKLNNKIVREHVKSENVLFMNDDVIMMYDAVETPLKRLQCPAVGTVGIKLIYPDKTIQHAGIFTSTDNVGQFRGVGHVMHKEYDRPMGPIWTCGNTGAFLMMKTELFNKVGGFPEQYDVCFEDVHLNWKVLAEGKMCLTCNDVSAVHFESSTRKNADMQPDLLKLSNAFETYKDTLYTYKGMIYGI